MAWLYLFGAIALELFATTSLKLSDGFTKLQWTLAMAVGYGLAFYLLSLVVRTMSLGLAYAVWSGVGTVGAVLISVYFFNEPSSPLLWLGAILVVGGVVLLNMASSAH